MMYNGLKYPALFKVDKTGFTSSSYNIKCFLYINASVMIMQKTRFTFGIIIFLTYAVALDCSYFVIFMLSEIFKSKTPCFYLYCTIPFKMTCTLLWTCFPQIQLDIFGVYGNSCAFFKFHRLGFWLNTSSATVQSETSTLRGNICGMKLELSSDYHWQILMPVFQLSIFTVLFSTSFQSTFLILCLSLLKWDLFCEIVFPILWKVSSLFWIQAWHLLWYLLATQWFKGHQLPQSTFNIWHFVSPSI